MESVVSVSAQNAGFTLIELMIVMVIVAIFVTVGVPNFQNMIGDNRLSTQANSLVSSLQFARSEALKTGTQVVVCRSTDGSTCAGGTGTTWESGWIVFVDADNNNAISLGDAVIQSNQGLVGGNTLRSAGGFDTRITYEATGLQTASAGTFRLCSGHNPDVNQGRQIAVSPTGHVQTTRGGLASCP
jgi:type IV fimbrial biogenesis protein FimT